MLTHIIKQHHHPSENHTTLFSANRSYLFPVDKCYREILPNLSIDGVEIA